MIGVMNPYPTLGQDAREVAQGRVLDLRRGWDHLKETKKEVQGGWSVIMISIL